MFYRYTHSDNKINNMTGFAMFCKNENRVCGGYGPVRYTYDGIGGVDIYDLREKFMQAWNECKDYAPDYMQEMTPDEFFESFNPDDIVDAAGAWDNSDFRMFFNDFIYDGESAILLDDGAIVFDENLIQEG